MNSIILVVLSGIVFVSIAGDEVPICEPGSKEKLPHPRECQLYIDCASTTEVPWLPGAKTRECEYPLLFDERTRLCQDFRTVHCGSRSLKVNACDYYGNQCNGPNCRPCDFSYPSCEGRPDGRNAIEWKLNSPMYAVCDSGRFIEEGKCPADTSGAPLLFNPALRECDKMENVLG
ncbi:uncharacterized protein LOC127870089 [Dreissena polymorpha]|uniref:Chitin-binding type-2 domain-containing protein n=1 Tax=Dreissena polymorpha TaxID=45954 RepID=A0A9D4MEC6_DREPO|nr:uncharacterized protein LOC127870089 [Dreissena polymorpha]KAH3873656.1 hypothetical protein DPMN_036893 [Dreissena polymorpha]